jgi:hypothetical protein
MGQAERQKKNSESDSERVSNKKPEQPNYKAKVNLPGIVQRVTQRNKPRPADVLHLQRALGNRTTGRMLGKTSVSAAAPNTVQRHVPPESEAALWQSRAELSVAKDQTKTSLASAESGAKSMLGSWNSVARALVAAKSLPAGGGGGQSSQGNGDFYEPDAP